MEKESLEIKKFFFAPGSLGVICLKLINSVSSLDSLPKYSFSDVFAINLSLCNGAAESELFVMHGLGGAFFLSLKFVF